jgi:hypothetical protein
MVWTLSCSDLRLAWCEYGITKLGLYGMGYGLTFPLWAWKPPNPDPRPASSHTAEDDVISRHHGRAREIHFGQMQARDSKAAPLAQEVSSDSIRQWHLAMKVVALLSGGKDSCYSILHAVANGHDVVAIASLTPQPGTGPSLQSTSGYAQLY